MNDDDKAVLVAIFSNGSKTGDTLAELSQMTGFSVQRLTAVAKRYHGQRFKAGTVRYYPPLRSSWKSSCPGIKNPRTGISASMPAEISID